LKKESKAKNTDTLGVGDQTTKSIYNKGKEESLFVVQNK